MTDFPDRPIDRLSPLPFYAQLADLLEQEIVSGRWEPTTRLPSEIELCRHFGLSQSPVRQALARLEQRGLIDRRKGKSTFVRSSPPVWFLQTSEGFFQDEVGRLGRTVTSKVLRAERVRICSHASAALDLVPHSMSVVIERLRSIDGKVALYVTNYLPDRLGSAGLMLDNSHGSLYHLLRTNMGVEPFGGRRRVRAVAADRRVADLLELPHGAPVAFIEAVSWDGSLQPFDFYHAWLRTDRVQIDTFVSGAAAGVTPLDIGKGGRARHEPLKRNGARATGHERTARATSQERSQP